jgi:hypothetical protein
MGAPFTSTLQQAQTWPIKAQGAVQRFKPFGDPKIENFYHKSLEDGRQLEKSVTDANNWMMEKRDIIQKHIQQAFNQVKLATDGKLDNPPRAIKYGYDIITFMQQVNQFQSEIIGLVSAATKNIGILSSMEQNILQMVQANLNAIASMLHDICNWALPDLPAIPNLFSDTIWKWNGFKFFPLASFIPHPNFDTNFAFGQCQLHVPNVNILRNFPTTNQTYSGVTFGTPLFVPPLGGAIPNTGVNLSDPVFIQQMKNTTNFPIYTPDQSYPNYFNPQSSMQGSLPNPATVISDYQMPPATYAANIVSTLPALAGDVIEPTDPDYSSPNLPVRQATLRQDLTRYVTLGNVVDSNFDPNLTSAWVFYLSSTRNGRAGQWLTNFEAAYQTFVQPSVDYLAANPIPWNQVLPGDVLNSGPAALPLILLLNPAGSPPVLTETQGNTLWRLSYVEAAVLGYVRNTTWDGYADNNYVGSFTQTDLDYQSIPTSSAAGTTAILLGEGEADYPVSCTFPTSIGKNLLSVISLADTRIQLDTKYQSVHPQYRYTYDQFAIAKQVDRFTQFWRDFNANLRTLLVQDPYIIGFVCAYVASLDSAIDPLGNPTDYNTVLTDASTRSRTWSPGFPLLPIPTAPIVTYSQSALQDPNQTGWYGTTLDPVAYLSRPDIQGQTIPVQMAMLSCNQSAASLMAYKANIQQAFSDAITTVQQQIQGAQNFGFQVESNAAYTLVPTGVYGAEVVFDQVDFDLTGYVSLSPPVYTITAPGAYAVTGQLNWEAGDAGVRTVTVYAQYASGSPPTPVAIITESSPTSQTGPFILPFSGTFNFSVGDILTVVATHGLSIPQQVGPGSLFSAVIYQNTPDNTPVAPPSPTSGGTQTLTADADMAALTAVYVDGSGGVVPVDPTGVTPGPSLSPPFFYDVYPYIDGVTLADVTTGNTVTIAVGYGSAFQIPGANFIPGGLLYARPGGVLSQDFNDVILSDCKWIIVAGRALDSQTFLYEPHIPTRAIFSDPPASPPFSF